jgi:hypothetical protein
MIELMALVNCDDLNIAGCPIIEYCPIIGLSAFQVFELTDGRLRGTIAFQPYFKWFRMPIRPLDPEKQLWAETPNSTAQGKTTDTRIEGIFPTTSPQIQSELDDMERQRFVLRVENAAGQKFVLGSPNFPLQFKANFSTARGFHTIEWYGKQLHKAIGY